MHDNSNQTLLDSLLLLSSVPLSLGMSMSQPPFEAHQLGNNAQPSNNYNCDHGCLCLPIAQSGKVHSISLNFISLIIL